MRPANSTDTRRRILHTAICLFKEQGYDAVTLAAICRAAGVSKHTFYHHYRAKEDLLTEYKAFPQDIRAEELCGLLAAENAFEAFWRLTEPMLARFAEMGPELMRRLFALRATSRFRAPETDPEDFRDLFAAHVALVAKAQAAGVIRNQSPARDLARAGISAVRNEAFRWCLRDDGGDLSAITRHTLETVFDISPETRKTPPQL